MTRARTTRGFTIVELMVVLTILMVVTTALYGSLMIGRSSFLTGDAYVHVQEEARRALDVMGRELRSAQLLADPAGGSILDFQVALGYNLAIAGCQPDQVCWGVVDQNGMQQPGWFVRYQLTGTQLQREIRSGGGVDSTRVLANDVQSTTFNVANEVVTLTVAVTQISNQLPGGSMPVAPGPLATRVALRN
jgi:prepilin-type N-terminal cleavage/methylation domain-containing protein